MVNKAALGILAVVIIAVVGVGMLVGTLTGGAGDAPTNDDDGGASGPSGTENGTQTADGTSSAPVSTDVEARTPVPDRRFNSTLLAENITRFINDARQSNGLDSLDAAGTTADQLSTMAAAHSSDMADEAEVGHNVTGRDIAQRYRDHDLFGTCKYSIGGSVYDPSYEHDDRFEVLGEGTVGDYAEVDGNQTFVENERQAARIIVDDWLADTDDSENLLLGARDKLLHSHFERVGVGVEITELNRVYATVDLCAGN